METISADQWEQGVPLDIETLWQECHQSIYHLVFREVHQQREVAEDITSMVFLRAWEANLKKSFIAHKPYAGFLWLRRIAFNLVIDYYRKSSTRLTTLVEDWNTIDKPDDYEFETQVENRMIIGQMLSLLPEDQRTLFLLQRVAGMTYEEIAIRQGTYAMAIKRKVKEAQETLQTMREGAAV